MADKPVAKDWPSWAQKALQGVCYWIGHRRQLYAGYPLSEGAFVAEVCNLIHANLPDRQMLRCEVMYSKLLDRPVPKGSVLTELARADLVVLDRKTEKPVYVIELKRLSAGNSEINADLARLAEVKRHLPHLKAYLFLVSEAKRPTRFVNDEGASHRQWETIPNRNELYRVRRTWKAAHAFKSKDNAQYACLIEVFLERQPLGKSAPI